MNKCPLDDEPCRGQCYDQLHCSRWGEYSCVPSWHPEFDDRSSDTLDVEAQKYIEGR